MLRLSIRRQITKSKDVIEKSKFSGYYNFRLKMSQPGSAESDPDELRKRSLYYYRKLVELSAELPPIDRRRAMAEFRYLVTDDGLDSQAIHAVCQHILDTKETAFAMINRRRDECPMAYREEDHLTRDKFNVLNYIDIGKLYREKKAKIEMSDAERDRQSF